MAVLVSPRYITLCPGQSSAIISLPFLAPIQCSLIHVHSGVCPQTNFKYLIFRDKKVAVCGDYGLQGGGALCGARKKQVGLSKTLPGPEEAKGNNSTAGDPKEDQNTPTGAPLIIKNPEIALPVKRTKESGTDMLVSDEEAKQAIIDLQTAMETMDLAGIVGNSEKLMKNSAEMDGILIEIGVREVTTGAIWGVEGVKGELVRQKLAQLIRISSFRHAFHVNKQPGFIYTQKKEYTENLEKCIKRIVKITKSNQDIDLHAELRASWAIIATINDERNIWDKVRNVLPKLANLAAIIDPIRYAGTLTQGILDLGSLLYDEYQHIKNMTLAHTAVTLSFTYIFRHHLSSQDILTLNKILQKCNRWNIAVLIVRLISEMLEERMIAMEVRMRLLELLEELSTFKKFFFRNNWKVRKSALLNLMKISETFHEPEIKKQICDIIEMRLLLENDPNVLPPVDFSTQLGSAQSRLKEPAFRSRVEKEVHEIHAQIQSLYASLHVKDESRAEIVRSEIQSAMTNLNHVSGLIPEINRSTEELRKSVSMLSNRTEEIAIGVEEIKSMLNRSNTTVRSNQHIRIVPQRNLDGSRFISRSDELERLFTIFSKPAAKVVILGLPGIGKSTLALKFLYLSEGANMFENYVWINAQKSSTIFADYLEVAIEMNISHGDESKQVIYAKNHLKHSSKTLIIYDNADFEDEENEEEIEAFVKQFFVFGNASVIITSRNEEWTNRISDQIRLDRLSRIDGISLISAISGIPSEEITMDIVDKLEGNPLNLRTAGTYLKQSRSKQKLVEKLDIKEGSGMDKIVGICYDTVTPTGKSFLETCAFLNADRIDTRVTSRLLKAHNVSQQVTTLSEIRSLALLDVADTGKVQMHRVVQESAYKVCPDKEKVERELGSCLAEMIEEGVDFDPDTMLNARFFHDRKRILSNDNRKIDRSLVLYCLQKRLGSEARRIALVEMEAQQALMTTLTPEEILHGYLQQAQANAMDNKHEEAEKWYKAAYDLSKDYPEKLFLVAFNLAKYEKGKGMDEMAKVHLEDALRMLPSVISTVSVRDQFDLQHLAGLLLSSDPTVSRSLSSFQEALSIAASAPNLRISPSDIAEVHYNIGDMYLKHIGYTKEAFDSLQAALDVLKPVQTDPLHAKIYRLMANNSKSDPKKPFEYLSAEVSFRKMHLPDDDSGLVDALLFLSDMHRLKNRNQEAISCLREAENMLLPGDEKLIDVYSALEKAAMANGNQKLSLEFNKLKEENESLKDRRRRE